MQADASCELAKEDLKTFTFCAQCVSITISLTKLDECSADLWVNNVQVGVNLMSAKCLCWTTDSSGIHANQAATTA